MFISEKWDESKFAAHLEGKTMVDNGKLFFLKFFEERHNKLNFQSLVRVLRLVDGEESHMDYFYDGYDAIGQTKEDIKRKMENNINKCMPILENLNERWGLVNVISPS